MRGALDIDRFMRASEAALIAGVKPSTIRYWKHLGLFAEADVWVDVVTGVNLFRLRAVLDVEMAQRRRRRNVRQRKAVAQ